MALLNVLALLAVLCFSGAVSISWPEPAIAWWYPVSPQWPKLIEEVAQHTNVVTSIMLYCGAQVTNEGTITDVVADECIDQDGKGTLPALWSLGIRTELTLGSGNCSIDSYRILWADTVHSIAVLVNMAKAANVSGFNIDLEPQSENCQGTGTGHPDDAPLFASWLSVLHQELNSIGVRLTVDVATWSPVLRQYSVLAPVVDRMMDMDTYNAKSFKGWMKFYNDIVNTEIPRSVAGVGLGCWVDKTVNGTWSVTPESAVERIAQAKSDNVPELAFWVLDPVTNVW